MGFKIKERSSQDDWVEAEETLWLTEDRARLVADGDAKAAHLFATAGKRISREDAEKYGLVKAASKPETKEAAPEEDKAAEPGDAPAEPDDADAAPEEAAPAEAPAEEAEPAKPAPKKKAAAKRARKAKG